MTENNKRKGENSPNTVKKVKIENKNPYVLIEKVGQVQNQPWTENIEIQNRMFRKVAKKKKKATGSQELRIANINVRGLKNKGKQQMVLDIFEKENLDILAIAETNLNQAEAKYLYRNNDKLRALWQGSENKGEGVGLIVRENLAKHIHKVHRVSERIIAIRMAFKGIKLVIISIYLPSEPKGKEKSTKILEDFLRNTVKREDNLLILGDFNGVPNPASDRNPKRQSQRPEGRIFGILKESKLRDITRMVYKNKPIFTWRGRGSASRIDAVWGSKSFLEGFQKLEIVDTSGYLDTDHQMIILTTNRSTALNQTVKVKDKVNHLPFATANTSEERWERFTVEVEGALAAEPEEKGTKTLNDQWESFSSIMIESANKHIPRRKERKDPKKWNSKLYNNFKKLVKLRRALHKGLSKKGPEIEKEENKEKIDTLAKKIDQKKIHIPKRTGPTMQAWREWADSLEFTYRIVKKEVNREFKERERLQIQRAIEKRLKTFGGNKKRALRSILDREEKGDKISRVIVEDRQNPVITDPEEVEKEVREHFKKGNRERSWNSQHFSEKWKERYTCRATSEEEEKKINKKITWEEINKVLKTRAKGKAAGPQGIAYEWIAHLGERGKGNLVEIMNACLTREDTPIKWKRALISPIPKGKEEEGVLSKLRPIALLEAPRKLFTKF